jgi:hypothetical protein
MTKAASETKPLSAYQMFCKKHYAQAAKNVGFVKGKDNGVKPTAVMSECARLWRAEKK